MEILCPNCDQRSEFSEKRLTYHSDISHEDYCLFDCSSCGLSYFYPRRTQHSIYDEGAVYTKEETRQLGERKLLSYMRPFFQRRPDGHGKKLLDIGCGDGVFMEFAQKNGFEVWGIDPDQKIVGELGARGFERVFALDSFGMKKLFEEKETRFDIISAFQLIEHLPELRDFLADVRALLTKEGKFIGAVPNADRVGLTLEHDTWDFPPHHFTWWTRDTLIGVLHNHGFNQVVVLPGGPYRFVEVVRLFFLKLKHLLIRKPANLIKRRSFNKVDWSRFTLEEMQVAQPAPKLRGLILFKKLASPLDFLIYLLSIPIALMAWSRINQAGLDLYFEARKS